MWAIAVLNVMFMDLCLDRYKDALVLLLREVLNRIQFRYNQAQLEELDDETLDDDVRTFDTVTVATDVTTKYLKTSTCILLSSFKFFFFPFLQWGNYSNRQSGSGTCVRVWRLLPR